MDQLKIVMEFQEGRVISMLLENNFLGRCQEQGIDACIVSPGASRPAFTQKYTQPGTQWIKLPRKDGLTRLESLFLKLGRWFSTRGYSVLRQHFWKQVESRMTLQSAAAEVDLMARLRPHAVFTPHASEVYGRKLIIAAQAKGIPTVGNLASWDNPYRPLKTRTDYVSCWSEGTKAVLCERDSYPPQRVAVIGAPAFDAYFEPDGQLTRDAFCAQFGLDPGRPIILYATLGQFRPFMDETGTFAALLEALDKGLIKGNPQIILRLHPLSRLPYFERFLKRDDITVSRFTGYEPGMMWTPTRAEIMTAGNLMRHADVCISPGSTMTIEPAIFDTPTVLPLMNLYTPDDYLNLFKGIWLDGHFKMLVEKDWVPLAKTVEDLANAVNRAFEDPAWYSKGRAAIRAHILGPLDGKATERLVELLSNVALNK